MALADQKCIPRRMQPNETEAVQVQHPVVSLLGGWHIDEHQQQPGDRQQDEQVHRQQAQAERVGEAQGMLLDLGRLDMQQERVEERLRTLALGLGKRRGPVDGLVDVVTERARAQVVPDFRGLPVDRFVQAGQRAVGGRAAAAGAAGRDGCRRDGILERSWQRLSKRNPLTPTSGGTGSMTEPILLPQNWGLGAHSTPPCNSGRDR